MNEEKIDYHCHLLPGIDDGPDDIEESLEMAVLLRNAGYRYVYCTPHMIRGCYDENNNAVRAVFADMRKALDANGIELEIIIGREYCMDEYIYDYLPDPMPLGDTKFILIEIPNHISTEYVKQVTFHIRRRGFIPMIAHPERSVQCTIRGGKRGLWPHLAKKKPLVPEMTNYLSNLDCAFQGNVGSFSGLYGPEIRFTALWLRENNYYTHFGTDAHSFQDCMKIMGGNV